LKVALDDHSGLTFEQAVRYSQVRNRRFGCCLRRVTPLAAEGFLNPPLLRKSVLHRGRSQARIGVWVRRSAVDGAVTDAAGTAGTVTSGALYD
jgi:hypothetical protein